MAHRHDVHKRAMRAKGDPVESFEKKDKYGDDKAANKEGFKPSAVMSEAKGRSRDKDVEGAVHGNRIKLRPGRRRGGAVGADSKPISTAGAGIGGAHPMADHAMGGVCARASGGAVGEFAKGGKVMDRDGDYDGDRYAKGGKVVDRDRDGYASGGRNWIAGATKNKGALHRHLGVPEGEKIPAKKLAKAEHSSNPTVRKEANLAKTLKGMHH